MLGDCVMSNIRIIEDSSRETYLYFGVIDDKHLYIAERDGESYQELWSAVLDSAEKAVFDRELCVAIEKGIIQDKSLLNEDSIEDLLDLFGL